MSAQIQTTRNGSGLIVGYRQDLAETDVIVASLTDYTGVTSVRWELVGRPSFSTAGGAGPEPILLAVANTASFTVDSDVTGYKLDGSYKIQATLNPGSPGETRLTTVVARVSGITIPRPGGGTISLRKPAGFEALEDTADPTILQGYAKQIDWWFEALRQAITGGISGNVTLAGAYGSGTSTGDQTLNLADAQGGGVVINGAGGSFTGQSSLRINSAAGGPVVVDRATGRIGVGIVVPLKDVHVKAAAPTIRLDRTGGAALDVANVGDELQFLNGATVLGKFEPTGGLRVDLGLGIGVAPVTGPALAFGAGSAVGISAAGTARFRYNEGTGHAEWSENGGAYQPFASPFSAYQTVDNAGTPLTQRTILNFFGGLLAVDNAGATRTDVSTLLTATQVGFGSGSNTLTGDPNFTYDGTNHRIGLGSVNPVSSISGGAPSSMLTLLNEGNSVNVRFQNSGALVGGVTVERRRSRGSAAAPTAVQAADSIEFSNWFGHDGTGYINTFRNAVYVREGSTVATGNIPTFWYLQANGGATFSGSNPNRAQMALAVDTLRNVQAGEPNLATNANDGFFYLPSATGPFTGTPTDAFGSLAAQNRTPAGIDVTDGTGRLYAYIGGAWHYAAFSDGATTLTATQVGFGSGANTLTGSAAWTFDSTNVQTTFAAAGTPTKTWSPIIINQTSASGSTVTTSDIRWQNAGTKSAAIRHFSGTTGSLDTIHIGSYSGSPLGEGVLFGSYSPITDSLSNVTLEVLPFLQDIFIGAGAQLATNAASGFVLLPRIAGTPTVAPTSQGGGGLSPGRISTVVDDGNSKVWYYIGGAWHFIAINDVAALFYQTVANGGSALTQRGTINFSGGLVAVDNGGATRTDVTTSLTATQLGFGGGSNTMVGDPNLNWDTTNGLLKIGSGTAYSVNDVLELTRSRNGITRLILNNPNTGSLVSASIQISAGSSTPLTNQLNLTFVSPSATTSIAPFVPGGSALTHVNSTATPFSFWNDTTGSGGDFAWYTQTVGPVEQLRLTNNGDVLAGQNALQWDNTNKRLLVGDLSSALPSFTGVAGQVSIVQSGTNNKTGLIVDTYLNTVGPGTFGGRISFRRASGTFSAPTAISGGANWDVIGWVGFTPYDGTSYIRTALVGAHVTPGATVSTGNIPTTFGISVSPTGNTNLPNGEVFQLTDTTLNLFFGDFLYAGGLTPPSMAIQQSGGTVTAANIPHQLTVVDETGFGARGVQISTHRNATGTSGAGFFLLRSRGTFATPTTTAVDDGVGQIFFQGYNGTAYLGAGIAGVVDHAATVDATHTPINIEFRTNAGAFYATGSGAQGIVGYNGDFVWGTSAIATNATQGFVWLRTTAGVPSQAPVVPTYNGTGTAVDAIATVIDSTDARLYAYVGGAWHFAAFNDGGAAPFYQTVDNAGSAVTQRPTLNFSGGLLAVDNAGAVRTDVTTTLTATQVGFGGGSNTMIGSSHLTFADAATAVLTVSSASTSAQLALNNVTNNTANRISFQQSGTTFGQFTFTKNTGVSNHAFVIVFQSAAPTADYHAVTNDVSAMAPLIAFASSGDAGLGSNLGVGLTDTAGFAYLPAAAGVPTGVPAPNAAMGTRNAFVADTTDRRLYAYIGGAWHYVFLNDQPTAPFYQTVDAAGTPLTQRGTLNFDATMTAVDNGGATRTDAGVALPAAGRVLVSAGAGATIVSDANVTVDTTAHELAIGTAGSLSWYNVTGTNLERVRAFFSAGVFTIAAQKAGTGVLRDIAIAAGSTLTMSSTGIASVVSPTVSLGSGLGQSPSVTVGGNVGSQTINVTSADTRDSNAGGTAGALFNWDGLRIDSSLVITNTFHMTYPLGANATSFAIPSYSGNAQAKTLDFAATVAIVGAPVASASLTITHPYAFWVQGDKTRLDGAADLNGLTTVSALLKATANASLGPNLALNGATPGANDVFTIDVASDATKDHVRWFIGGGVNINTPSNSFFDVIPNSTQLTNASNTGIMSTVRLGSIHYSNAPANAPTVSEVTTLLIVGPPTTAGVSVTNGLNAIHVLTGDSRFDADVYLCGSGGGPSGNLSFFGSGGAGQLTAGGSRGGNTALASLISILATYGLIVDGTSP